MNNLINLLESLNSILKFYNLFAIWDDLLTMSSLVFIFLFFIISTSNKFFYLLNIINKTDKYDLYINKLIKLTRRQTILSILIFINIFFTLIVIDNYLKQKINDELSVKIEKFKKEPLEVQKAIINENIFYDFIIFYSAFLNNNDGRPEDKEKFLKYLFSLSNNNTYKTNSTITNKISINP